MNEADALVIWRLKEHDGDPKYFLCPAGDAGSADDAADGCSASGAR